MLKKATTDAIKTASKRGIQKTAKVIGDLTGNKTADKITIISTELQSNLQLVQKMMMLIVKLKCQKTDAYLEKKGNKFLMN